MDAALPTGTYRLQFNGGFTFEDAAELVPYLKDLGVSHIYGSPWLKAQAGSAHGYDVVDFSAIAPELGGEAGFEKLHRAASAHGLRHILDFVSNHMGIAGSMNAWWMALLEEGRAAPTAKYFDIEWNLGEAHLHNKVLLPVLGEHYGEALGENRVSLRFDADTGRFSAWYHQQRLPIAWAHYGAIFRFAAEMDHGASEQLLGFAAEFEAAVTMRPTMRRARVEELAQRLRRSALISILERCCERIVLPPPSGAAPLLHGILKDQHYALAYWGTAADEINYRRFFNINELAGLRMENPALFEPSHALVMRLAAEGKVHGLRIDHVDGLLDPRRYCREVHDATQKRAGDGFYVVVEKILARHEHLRADWPVHGTTGYDFIAQVSHVLVDQRGEDGLTAAYARFTGEDADFTVILAAAKGHVIDTLFRSELRILARRLHRITRRFWKTPDFTENGLARALRDLAVHLPVYRTYIDRAATATAEDRRDLDWALGRASEHWTGPGRETLSLVAGVINGDFGRENPGLGGTAAGFALKFQQFTAPVTAKGLEDTAFYRYHRLISLNEVGGDPRACGGTVADFHAANQARAAHSPHGMLTTATHDTKRGEDARARVHVLSEMPEAWSAAAGRWAALNLRHKTMVGGRAAPSANEEYLIYQTLVGTWPVEVRPDLKHLAGRLHGFMTKALREAKQNTLWDHPDTDYEAAVLNFIDRILDPAFSAAFLGDFARFHAPVAQAGMLNSLVQTTLKLTSPGVPDTYRGTETWDFSLVDPDNRRPVDFAARKAALIRVQRADPAALRADWRSGDIKTFVTHRLLQLRRRLPAAFQGYEALPVDGTFAGHVIAFRRGDARTGIAVVTGRHFHVLQQAWGDTSLTLPEHTTDIFTGRVSQARLALADVLGCLPVAVFAWDGL